MSSSDDISQMLSAAVRALCGCGEDHAVEAPDDDPWRVVPMQCGSILYRVIALMLNRWSTETPCPVDEYLSWCAVGLDATGPGQSAPHLGFAMMRIMRHWLTHGDDWPGVTDEQRERMIRAVDHAARIFDDVIEETDGDDGGDGGDLGEVLDRIQVAADVLGIGSAAVGLDHMDETARAYVQSAAMAGAVHGRLSGLLSLVGGHAPMEAAGLAQDAYALSAASAASATPGVASEHMGASVVMGASMMISRWFERHSDTVPRAGAVWRLMSAASLLNHADAIAAARHGGYADRLATLGDHDESDAVAEALTLMRESVTAIELETK